jgi:hypothetical protein
MRIAVIGLATALALASTAAFAQEGSANRGYQAGCGSSSCGVTAGAAGASMSNNAGSAAAGANSADNPSGNSFINTSPSGSTLMPGGGPNMGGRR